MPHNQTVKDLLADGSPAYRQEPVPRPAASDTARAGGSTVQRDPGGEQQAYRQSSREVKTYRGNQFSRRRVLAAFYGLGASVWSASKRSGYPSDEGQQEIRRLGMDNWRAEAARNGRAA